jgi:hypothetical protein
MAPIRWFSHGGRQFGWMLLGGCLALALAAAPASAELSSVDAYGGQAQVLGPPVHRHGAAGGSSARGHGHEGGRSAATTGSQSGDGSAGSPSGSGSNATTGSSSGAPATPSGSHGATGEGEGSTASGGGPGSAGGGAGATGAGGASGVAGGQSSPIALATSAEVSNGSLSLSALDALLLAVVFAGLVCVGVLIRRWSRQSE